MERKNSKLQQELTDVGEEIDKEKEERKKLNFENQGLKNNLENERFKREKFEKEMNEMKAAMANMQMNSADKEKLKLAEDQFNDVTMKLKTTNDELII